MDIVTTPKEHKIETSIKKRKEAKHVFAGKIKPHGGHTIWEVNNETQEIVKAPYANATYYHGEENKKEIIIKKDHSYISALNKKSALKKFKKGSNGSKPFNTNPISFY